MGSQAAVGALEARIGDVISLIAAMQTRPNQFAPYDPRDLVAAFAAIVGGFPRNLTNLLAHGRISWGLMPNAAGSHAFPVAWLSAEAPCYSAVMNQEIAAGLQLPRLEKGWVWLVGAGPGDPGLITALGLQALADADYVL